MVKPFLTLIALASFTACTTLQPLPDAQPATLQQSIHPGDTVEVVRNDGSKQQLKVEQITPDVLQGSDSKRRYTIPLRDIRTVSTRVMTTSDKVWTGVVVAVIVGGIVAAVSDGGGGGGGGGPGY